MHSYKVVVSTHSSGLGDAGTDVNSFYENAETAYEAYHTAKKMFQDHVDRKNTKETSFAIEDMFGETAFETNSITRVRIIDEFKWTENLKEVMKVEKQMKNEIGE
jgi:hypothetical protein